MGQKIITSTTHQVIHDLNPEQLKYISEVRIKAIKPMFDAKLGNNYTVVTPLVHGYLLYKVNAFKDSGVNAIPIAREDFDSPPELPTNTPIIFMPFNKQGSYYPMEQWIDSGYVKKEHIVFAMAKDPKMKEYFREKTTFWEMWANAYLHAGVKFPNCSGFHVLSEQTIIEEDKKDPDYKFIKGQCKCGMKTPIFVPQKVNVVSPS